MAKLTSTCRLCRQQAHDFMVVDGKAYLACDHCGLRMMHHDNLPSSFDEKAHYDQHDNRVDDIGYQQFLSRLADPLMAILPPSSSLLDFGSGPGSKQGSETGSVPSSERGSALAEMMRNAGHQVALYDPFYAPHPSVLSAEYDAVMATEVVEHFHHPHDGFKQMLASVRAGGWLAIMTNLQDDDAAFANWYYRRDPTHVAFYREETLAFIGQEFGLKIDRISRNVTIYQKPF